MPRVSAFRGNFIPNARPFVTLAPDAFVSIQGETTVIGCGECRREININQYLTGVSTEASVDSPPGSASFNLSIPDTDINNFYVDDQLLIIPMMEVEIYAKGYYTIGGFPQYYRIFWGLVSTVTKSWSNGVTTVSISCKDILRWWELTQVNINAAWMNPFGSSTGQISFWGNQFAGANPTTVIIALARDAMGDFSHQTGSFQQFLPEQGPEGAVLAGYGKDIMAYWQLKFANIWNNLVVYGTSGKAYTFTSDPSQVSPYDVSQKIFEQESDILHFNKATEMFKTQPSEVAVAKFDLSKAPDFVLFEAEQRSKLSIATDARDQVGFEFYCDTTGDIIFKPPFYNLNVIPNKPVSWINDFEIMEDSITDSEAEVYTHITSSGNAFGGLMDVGASDEITTQRTGAIDYHLLRRYGWRRLDKQVEWAANAKKLYFFLLDFLDRTNAKRQNGTVTIPMRPEIRMGFPVWIPKYDSFFYVQAVSHNFSIGGQATTTLTLTAKRSKFIAPKNIGKITRSAGTGVLEQETVDGKVRQTTVDTYIVEFPDNAGNSSGIVNDPDPQKAQFSEGAIIRNPKTGKILGFPNAVMVFRAALDGQLLTNVQTQAGYSSSHQGAEKATKTAMNQKYDHDNMIKDNLTITQLARKQEVINRLRSHRYEAAISNAGAYDYAWDTKGDFKEITIIPTNSIKWGPGTIPPKGTVDSGSEQDAKNKQQAIDEQISITIAKLKTAQDAFVAANEVLKAAQEKLSKEPNSESSQALEAAQKTVTIASQNLDDTKTELSSIQKSSGSPQSLTDLNVMIRPVSDEFGFEVIGHSRYGRGAYIDLGKVQVKDKSGLIANQLGIQFSQTGGFLQDSMNMTAGVQGPVLQFLSETFDRMRPDDFQTGASFSGSRTGDKATIDEVNITSQQTYTENMKQNKGKLVFIEADATRKALTLAELSPTLDLGALSEATVNCNCVLNKTNWLSIFPQSVLSKIIQGNNPQVFKDSAGFFETLNNYLTNNIISKNYEINAKREMRDVSGTTPVIAPSRSITPRPLQAPALQPNLRAIEFYDVPPISGSSNNIFPDSANPIFARASQGDPEALKILQNDVNLNFGLTKKGLQDFNNSLSEAKIKLNSSLSDITGSGTKSSINVTTDSPSKQALKDAQTQLSGATSQLNRANQLLASNPGSAFARNAVNKAKNNVSSIQTQMVILQNNVNTGTTPPQVQPTGNPPMVGDLLNSTKFSAATGDVFVPKIGENGPF